MPGAVFARGDEVTLRTVEPEDVKFFHRWHNDPALREAMLFTVPKTESQIEDRIEEWTEGEEEGFTLLVCQPGEDGPRPVGNVSLYDVRRERGEIAYWIVPDARGEGLASDGLGLLLDHAFGTLGLHRVYARVLDFNEASRGFLESLGFEREGRLREHVWMRGEYRDQLWYGLLESEWIGTES